jgi:hypothetical protein
LSFAAGHINVSAADKIPSETLFAAIKGEPIDQKFDYHRWMFFDETDTATIADLVLGGEITFAELAATADRLLPESHDTRIWLDERRNT